MFATSRRTYYDTPQERLSGYINGDKASDIEERFARSLAKLGIGSAFRLRLNNAGEWTSRRTNVAGEVELDFWTSFQGRVYPFQIQGEISHFYTAHQSSIDAGKRAKINAALPLNAHPVIDVPFWLLNTQERADRMVRRGFLSGWATPLYLENDPLKLRDPHEREKEKQARKEEAQKRRDKAIRRANANSTIS